MVPRLIFAALMFGSLASRPVDATGRRHQEIRAVQGQPALAPVAACAPPRS